MNFVYIYTLTDPRDGIIKYVGKTQTELKYRLNGHGNELHLKRGGRKNNWIRSLKNLGLMPIIEELDRVDINEWGFWEQYWISQIKTWGFDLKNESEGGYGPVGHKPSKEALEKRSISLKKAYAKLKSNPEVWNKRLEWYRENQKKAVVHNTGKKRNLDIFGDKAFNAKLTNDEVVEIRQLHSMYGMVSTKICDQYGLKRHAMRKLLNGVTWEGVY